MEHIPASKVGGDGVTSTYNLANVFLTTMDIPLSFIIPTLPFLSHVTWSFCIAGTSATCLLCWAAQVVGGADPSS